MSLSEYSAVTRCREVPSACEVACEILSVGSSGISPAVGTSPGTQDLFYVTSRALSSALGLAYVRAPAMEAPIT